MDTDAILIKVVFIIAKIWKGLHSHVPMTGKGHRGLSQGDGNILPFEMGGAHMGT